MQVGECFSEQRLCNMPFPALDHPSHQGIDSFTSFGSLLSSPSSNSIYFIVRVFVAVNLSCLRKIILSLHPSVCITAAEIIDSPHVYSYRRCPSDSLSMTLLRLDP